MLLRTRVSDSLPSLLTLPDLGSYHSAPVDWKTPEGSSVSVHLQMQMAAAVTGVDSAYIGIQTRGVLWPAPPPRLPALWPVGPPTIIGKVCHITGSFKQIVGHGSLNCTCMEELTQSKGEL